MNVTFDNLPEAVAGLYARLDSLEKSIKGAEENPVEQDDLLIINQAADLVKKSVPTVYDLVHKREIPFYKRGGRLYFSKLELIAWIKEGKIPTNEEIRAVAAASRVNERRSRIR